MKSLKLMALGLVLLSNFAFSADEIPQQCIEQMRGFFGTNHSHLAPEQGPVHHAGEFYCYWRGHDDDGNWTHGNLTFPIYWIPGKKLPNSTRQAIERRFVSKIVELKGQGKFTSLVSYLIQFVPRDRFERIYSLLQGISFILPTPNRSEMAALLKHTIVDVMVDYHLRRPLESKLVIYYGLTKAQEFGVLSESVDINQVYLQVDATLSENATYNERYTALMSELEKLNLSVF